MTKPRPTTLAAEPLDQADGGRRRPAGGQHVVDDQDPLADVDGVAVDLEQVGAVLELVLLGLDLPGQLARLADGHEAGAEPVGDRGGDDEPPGLDADDLVDARRRRSGSAMASTASEKPSGSARRGVMSLKTTPALGKSGMSRIRSLSRGTSGSTHSRVPARAAWSVSACGASAGAGAAAPPGRRVGTGRGAWRGAGPAGRRRRLGVVGTPSARSVRGPAAAAAGAGVGRSGHGGRPPGQLAGGWRRSGARAP